MEKQSSNTNLDISSPYYLHPNENPSLVLVSPPLDGRNHHSWARSMRLSLISKNKMKFVDGTLSQPSPLDPLYEAWERCNTMVLGWLHHSMTEQILQSILWIDQAAAVWKDLHDRFSQGDLLRISDLQEDFYKLHQGDLTVTDYFTRLKTIWDELENFRPLPRCKCAIACSCGAVDVFKKYRDEDYVIRFLKGLNEQYSHVKSQVLMLEPLPPLTKVFSMLVQQERQMNTTITADPNSNLALNLAANQVQKEDYGRGTFSSRGRGRGKFGRGRGQQGSKLCTHCGFNNHTIEECFFKIGFPPGYRSKNSKNNDNHKSINSIASSMDVSTDLGHKSTSELFTPEQYQSLLALIQQNNKPPSSSVHASNMVQSSTSNSVLENSHMMSPGSIFSQWLLDTGTTDHITFHFSSIKKYHKINPISIMLPNGNSVCASFAGTVVLSPSLTLYDVLYVPEFKVNLISVTKLLKTIPCSLIFTDTNCVIMQEPTKRMIGSAKLKNRVVCGRSSRHPTSK